MKISGGAVVLIPDMKIPTDAVVPIPDDPHGRTSVDLGGWLRSRGTSLYKLYIEMYGSPVARKKEALLKLAEEGAPPPAKGDSLRWALYGYTSPSSVVFDPVFNAKIRSLRPGWFRKDRVRVYKDELTALARSGAPVPRGSSSLALRFQRYTNPVGPCYDHSLTEVLRCARPDWFLTRAEIRKAEFIRLAGSGAPRPSRCGSFDRYLCYDASFREQVRTLRPDWFRWEAKKARFLELVESGGLPKKPIHPHPFAEMLEARVLRRNPEFAAKIRLARPGWFETSADRKKRELLCLARAGAPRPDEATALGAALCRYILVHRRNFDKAFYDALLKTRPDWIHYRRSKLEATKQALLQLARGGDPRPRASSTLGRALHNYTVSSSSAFDTNFSVEIRKLRPDWFDRSRLAAVGWTRRRTLAA